MTTAAGSVGTIGVVVAILVIRLAVSVLAVSAAPRLAGTPGTAVVLAVDVVVAATAALMVVETVLMVPSAHSWGP